MVAAATAILVASAAAALMARRLIEAGTRLVSVTAWTGLPPGEKFRNVQTWDMHGNGPGLGRCCWSSPIIVDGRHRS